MTFVGEIIHLMIWTIIFMIILLQVVCCDIRSKTCVCGSCALKRSSFNFILLV